MTDLSKEEFNARLDAAVRTTINLLDDAALFEEEVARLLQENNPALRRLTKKVIRASKERGDTYAYRFVPRYLGGIYAPAELVKDIVEMEDEDTQDEDGDERGEVVLQPTCPYVFLKIALHNPRHERGLEPHVMFGRISAVGAIGAQAPFTVPVKTKRNRLKHLLAAIHPGSEGRWLDTRARLQRSPAVTGPRRKKPGALAILLDGSIEYHSLYELRSEDGPAQIAAELSKVAKSLPLAVRGDTPRHVKRQDRRTGAK